MKGHWIKKTSRAEIDKKIISGIKREIDLPRLTEPVRNGFSTKAAPKPITHSTRA
jgi:hypothetical protein